MENKEERIEIKSLLFKYLYVNDLLNDVKEKTLIRTVTGQEREFESFVSNPAGYVGRLPIFEILMFNNIKMNSRSYYLNYYDYDDVEFAKEFETKFYTDEEIKEYINKYDSYENSVMSYCGIDSSTLLENKEIIDIQVQIKEIDRQREKLYDEIHHVTLLKRYDDLLFKKLTLTDRLNEYKTNQKKKTL